MKYLYIVVGIVAFYAAFSYARFLYILKSHSLPRIEQADQVLGQGPELVYVAAGDSTAVGVGATDLAHTYTTKLAQALARTHQVHYVNVAVSGAKTADVLENQVAKIMSAQPDIITLSVGANDTTHLYGTTAIIQNYKTILDKLVAETHAHIYLTNIPILKDAPLLPLPFRKLMEYKAQRINASLNTFATDRVHIVPIHDFGWNQFADISVTFAADQFHPSDIGYENWTNAFKATMHIGND